MNKFEGENTQGRGNDVQDAGRGFLVTFGFFTLIYIIAQVFDLIPK